MNMDELRVRLHDLVDYGREVGLDPAAVAEALRAEADALEDKKQGNEKG